MKAYMVEITTHAVVMADDEAHAAFEQQRADHGIAGGGVVLDLLLVETATLIVEAEDAIVLQHIVGHAGDIADDLQTVIVAEIIDAGTGRTGEPRHGEGNATQPLPPCPALA